MPEDIATTLIVPITVDALVMNQAERNNGLRRWECNYRLLSLNLSPEPLPFTNEDPRFKPNSTDFGVDGVYLQWQLPRALCQGTLDAQGRTTTFPLVPNRWLVVRRGQQLTQRVWVVESDFLHPTRGTSPFVHPYRAGVTDPRTIPFRSEPTPTRIGRVRELNRQSWQEPEQQEMFLTAVGPGLPEFHVFQPYNENVFSMHDPLDDHPAMPVDYLVIGWYSDVTNGVPEIGKPVPPELGWLVSGPQRPVNRTLCVGRVAAVNTENVEDPYRPKAENVEVAVGNDMTEAFSSLIRHIAAEQQTDLHPRVLDAAQRGLLDRLGELDGDIVTDQLIHRSWFEQSDAGTIWRLDPQPGTATTTWTTLTPDEERMLAELNTRQSTYDSAVRELRALQWRLYALWSVWRLPMLPPRIERADLDNNIKELSAEISTRQESIKNFLKEITDVRTQLDPMSKRLRSEPLPPFQRVNDPTVMLSGATGGRAHPPIEALPLNCRFGDELFSGSAPEPWIFQTYPWLGLFPMMPALPLVVEEFERFHQGQQPPPDHPAAKLPSVTWNGQPWQPLFVQWTISHWTIPNRSNDSYTWTFDGQSYSWTNPASMQLARSVSGRELLHPVAPDNVRQRLQQHTQHRTDNDAEALRQLADDLGVTDVLAQRMSGFTDRLAGRDPAPNLAPPPQLRDLVGHAYQHTPDCGPQPGLFEDWLTSEFPQWRAGQMYFEQLCVVDRFGRTVDVLLPGDKNNFTPVVAPSFTIGTQRIGGQVKSEALLQLPPRLLQAARLRFEFISNQNDQAPVDLTSATTPVCAWLIPNYLDRALLCYDPQGAPLGELRIAYATAQNQVVVWDPLPETTTTDIDIIRDQHPWLHGLATTLIQRGAGAFTDLLVTIDRALAGIDPGEPYGDEMVGALLGRPLALVRTRIGIELDGPPLRDINWQYLRNWRAVTDPTTYLDPDVEYLQYPWPVRLGNAGQAGDGLIGYYQNKTPDRFYAVDASASASGFIAAIDSHSWINLTATPENHAHRTLLIDPMAAVHATTDVLPVGQLLVPRAHVQAALRALAATIRLGPILTPSRPPDKSGPHVVLPRPVATHGMWDWAQRTTTTSGTTEWQTLPITPSDVLPHLSDTLPTIRTGLLRLRGALGQTTTK